MKLQWKPADSGLLISEHRLIGRSRPASEWAKSGEPRLQRALSTAQRLADEAEQDSLVCEYRPDGLFLNHALVAELPEADASALDLPASVPLGLRFNSTDQVMAPEFRVSSQWVRYGGVPVRTRRDGSLISFGGNTYRVPQPMFGLLAAAEPLTGPLAVEERTLRYADFCEAVRTSVNAEIDVDQYLDDVTVFHAAAFSLRLGVSNDAFDFDPVLFERQMAQDAKAGEPVDEIEGALLSEYNQRIFIDRFRGYSGVRPAYALESGSFVVIDPSLRPAFNIVRQAASADSETRRRFIANPTGFIKAELPDQDLDILDDLFVETEQYSERVTGIDIWRKPVLPWIKPAPHTWIPENFGLQVGEDDAFEILPEKVDELREAFEEAKARGEQILEWDGKQIPVTEQAEQAINSLHELNAAIENAKQQGAQDSDAENEPPPVLEESRFLTVSDNLETLAYEAPANRIRDEIVVPSAPPPSVKATLKSYQTTGFQWLAAARLHGLPGVLLADDMGLGKTLQTLAFLAWNKSALGVGRNKPILIVAPTGLLANWKAEIRKHLEPSTLGEVIDAYGSALRELKSHPKAAPEIKVGQTVLDVTSWQEAGVVLTTYETMRDFHFSFAKIHFETLVFDEVQKLKNPSSQLSRAARALNANFKVGMSGTPVENRMQDLWSIMDVLWPGFLGTSKNFESMYPASDADRLEELHEKIFSQIDEKPAVGLRRLKSDELDGLPEKKEMSESIQMPPAQANAYARVVARAVAMKGDMLAAGGMLKTLQELRSISLHPEPPSTGYDDMDGYVEKSARLKAVIKHLFDIRHRNEKALIFLESREMQDFLADYLYKKFDLKRRPHCISGQVPGARRQDYVDDFQARGPGFDVMILSPKAGGVGLTITAANHVIHLSRWWNPAIEDQSTDRAFRIGQTKPVSVYYPLAVHPSQQLSAHSFDVKLDALLRGKRALAGRMLLPPEDRESDSWSLFSDVVSDETTSTEIAYQPDSNVVEVSPIVVPTEEEAGKAIPPTPVSAQEIQEPAFRKLVYKEGTPPDLAEVFGGIDGWEINRMALIDPYAPWRADGVKALAQILTEVTRRAENIKLLELEFFPPQKVPGRDYDRSEDSVQVLRNHSAVLASRLEKKPPRISYQERRKSKDRDFHDRLIVIDATSNGQKCTRTYSVPRGLDAFARHDFRLEIFVEDEIHA